MSIDGLAESSSANYDGESAEEPVRLFATSISQGIIELDPVAGTVLNSFSAPLNQGVSDGLAFDGSSLWYLSGSWDSNTLYQLNPDSGAVIDTFALPPNAFRSALAVLNGLIYITNWGAADQDIIAFDPVSGSVVNTLDINGLNSGVWPGGGLAAIPEANVLLMPERSSQNVHEIDPTTGLITNTFTHTRTAGIGVAYLDGQIYIGKHVGQPEDVYIFDRTGLEVGLFNIPGASGVQSLAGGAGAIPPQFDFGDAPDPGYPTSLVNDGARHLLVSDLWLGAGVDSEVDGAPSALADGDDLVGVPNDEDGVIFVDPLIPGTEANITVDASAVSLLDAWIDFNGNGSFLDPGEQIYTSEPLAAGPNGLVVNVPDSPGYVGKTYARFRVSSAGGLLPAGQAADGEVEDYAVGIQPELISSTPGSRAFWFTAGVVGASDHIVEYTVGGGNPNVVTTYDPRWVTEFSFDGADAKDWLYITGNDADAQFAVDADTYSIAASGSTYNLNAVGFEDIRPFGGAGTDTLTAVGAASGAYNEYTGYMPASGSTSKFRVYDYDAGAHGTLLFRVDASSIDIHEADANGSPITSTAWIDGVPGSPETLIANPAEVTLDNGGTIIHRMTGFSKVTVDSRDASTDGAAYLTGGDGRNIVSARHNQVSLYDYGGSDKIDVIARNFGHVEVDATASGSNPAERLSVFDRPGSADVYTADAAAAEYSIVYAAGNDVIATGFASGKAYASGDPGDTAIMLGTAGNEITKVVSTSSTPAGLGNVTMSGTGFYNVAVDFTDVRADGLGHTGASGQLSYIYGKSTDDDTIKGYGEGLSGPYVTAEFGLLAGIPAWTASVTNSEKVRGYGRGGNDVGYLYGSQYDDIANTSYALNTDGVTYTQATSLKTSEPGRKYEHFLKGFDVVYADVDDSVGGSGVGGFDLAYITDWIDDDTLTVIGKNAVMRYAAGPRVEFDGFDKIRAYALDRAPGNIDIDTADDQSDAAFDFMAIGEWEVRLP